MEITEEKCQDLFSSETIVYLTPDAEEGSSSDIFKRFYLLATRWRTFTFKNTHV